LVERCGQIIDNEGNVQHLDEPTLNTVKELKDRWSSEGKRVILLARKVVKSKDLIHQPTSAEYEAEVLRHVKTDLVLVGLVGIVDPPREEIPSVVKTLRRAGIRVFMVGFH
jgi:sodium/potassium-transporting ATPase subunit alpha